MKLNPKQRVVGVYRKMQINSRHMSYLKSISIQVNPNFNGTDCEPECTTFASERCSLCVGYVLSIGKCVLYTKVRKRSTELEVEPIEINILDYIMIV